MRILKLIILLTLTLASVSRAGEARFFRIAGPVVTTVTAFSADGYVTWTNTPTNATFTVQTASSLLSPINWVNYVQVSVTNSTTTHQLYDPHTPTGMAFIPAGSFTMGSVEYPGYDEDPVHIVYVSGFCMDKYEVTKALWDDVYNWAITHGYGFDYADSGQGKAANHPAHSMTWYDAAKWCNARSEKEGRVPAYYTTIAQTTIYRTGRVTLDNSRVKWNAGYRLPTEAEWEKAARGGAAGQRFPWGNTISHGQANYYGYPVSSGGYAYDLAPLGYHPTFNGGIYPWTSPVGYFAPNAYGLYEMAGNVWEWCWDWFDVYSSESQTDPRGPTSGVTRVFRGGSWLDFAIRCRSASRVYYAPIYRHYDFGFRCVRAAGQ